MGRNKIFQEALEAINNGDKDRARNLLYDLVKSERENVEYWLYLSSVLENPKEILFCIKKALEIDPQNATALRGLTLFGTVPDTQLINPIKPIRERKFKVPITLSGASVKKQKTISRKKFIPLILLGLVGVFFIYSGLFGNPFSNNPTAYILPSGDDLKPLPATHTPTIMVNSPAPIATLVPVTATAISIPLKISLTATPRLVDTPHPDSEAYILGLSAFDQENYEVAIENFLNHISNFPEDVDVRFYLGLAYFHMGEYQEADKTFLWTTEINPEFGLAYLWDARSELAYLDEPSIANKLMQAVKYAPEHYGSYLERGEYFLREGSMEYALGDLETALEMAPENAEVHLFAANYYLTNELYEDALLSAQTAMGLNPTIPEIYFVLGKAYFYNNLFEEVLSPLQSYLKNYPENIEALFLLARAQQNSNYHEAALFNIDQIEILIQDFYEIYLYKGISLFELGKIEEAVYNFKLATEYYPDYFESKLYHGVGLMGVGDFGEGYLEINASSSFAKTQHQLAMLYYWRAHSLELLDEREKARLDWGDLLALDRQYVNPKWAEIANLAMQGNYDSASLNLSLAGSEGTITPTP